MKVRELLTHAKCDLCGKLIGASGVPVFWTLRLQSHGVKLDALRRQDGLTAMLGSAELAGVMGPDEDLTQTLNDVEVTVCHNCTLGDAMLVHRLAEIAEAKKEKAA